MNFLLALREAAKKEVKPEIRDELKQVADNIQEILYELCRNPTDEALKNLQCQWVRGLKILSSITPEVTPTPPAGAISATKQEEKKNAA